MTKLLIFSAVSLLALSACSRGSPTSDQQDSQQTQDVAQQAAAQVPLPTITKFAARRTMKAVYEGEDQQSPTFSYNYNSYRGCYVPFGGNAQTFGYPVPGATQMTNPQKVENSSSENWLVMPQQDPDDLFKPSSETATYVMQYDKTAGKNLPQYSEPDLITLTHPVDPKYVC